MNKFPLPKVLKFGFIVRFCTLFKYNRDNNCNYKPLKVVGTSSCMCKKANLLLSLKVKEIMKFFHIYLLFTRTYELKKGDILKSYYIISNQTNLMVFKSRYKQISSNQVFQVVTVDYIGISNIHILQ